MPPGFFPPSTGPDWASFGWNVLFAILWTVVAVLCFSIAIPLALRLFNWMTPRLDEIEELRKGNVAVGILLAAFILAMAAVVIAILLK